MEIKREVLRKWLLLYIRVSRQGCKLLKELAGLGTGRNHGREDRLASDSERLWKASDAAIMVICKGKKSNQRVFSGMSIKWRCSRDWGWQRGVTPNTQRYHLKRLELFEKGREGTETRKVGGEIFQFFCLKRRNHLKFLVHRFVFCLFVCSCFLLFVFQEKFCRSYIFKVYIL